MIDVFNIKSIWNTKTDLCSQIQSNSSILDKNHLADKSKKHHLYLKICKKLIQIKWQIEAVKKERKKRLLDGKKYLRIVKEVPNKYYWW